MYVMEMIVRIRVTLASLVFVALASPVVAQGAPPQDDPHHMRYDVPEMNFDLWCQEQQHLPPDRCDKRLPEDDAAFNAYREKIERYEIPYLQDQQRRIDIDRTILHNDPVDNPQTPAQKGDQPTTATPPPPK